MNARLLRLFAGALTLAVATLTAPGPQAATSTAIMAVSASLNNNCSLGAASLNFGNFVPTAASTATTSVSWTCTTGAPTTLAFASANFAGGNRQLKNGANILTYSLCGDSTACGSAITNGTALAIGGAVLSNCTSTPGTGGNCSVFGLVPAQPATVSGSYSDTVTMTLTF